MNEQLSVEFKAVIGPFMQGLEALKKGIESLGNLLQASVSGAAGKATQEMGKLVDAYGREVASVQTTATATAASEAEKRKAIELTRIAEARRVAEANNDARQLLRLKAEAARAEAAFQKESALSKVTPKAAGAVGEMDEIEAIYAKHRQDMLAIDLKYNQDVQVLTEERRQETVSAAAKLAVTEAQLAQTLRGSQIQAQTRTNALRLLALEEYQAKRLAILKSEGTQDEKKAQLEAAEQAHQKKLTQIQLNEAQERIRFEAQEEKRKLDLQKQDAKRSNDRIKLGQIETKEALIAARARLELLKAEAVAGGAKSGQEARIKALLAFKKEAKVTFDEYIANIKKAEEANIRLNKAAELEGALQAVNQISLRVAAIGVAITAGFVAAIKPAADLEKQLAAVQAVSGKSATEGGMAALREQAIDLGRQFVFTSAEIANGMKFLAQAGFEVPEIKTMTKDILDLAMAADMPLKDAFNIAATTIRAFNKTAEGMSEVANTLTTVANETNVEVQDLAESFKYAGPVAAAAGVEFKDVASALGLMANAGIKGSMGGTALRQTISSLIAPTSNQRKIIRELGLETVTATGKFVGFNEIVGQLEQIFRDKIPDAADQAGIAMKLFGDRAGPGMLAVINAGQVGMDKLTQAAKDAENGVLGAGSASETAAQRMKNLQDSITKFGQAVSGLTTTVLFPLLNTLRSIVDWAAKVVNSFTDFAKAHPTIASIMAGFTAIVALAGLLAGAMATAAMAVAAFGLSLAANAKHGVTFGVMLRSLTVGFFSLVPAAGAAGGAVTGFSKALQLASKGTVILAVIGAIVSMLPFLIKLFGDWGRELGLIPPKTKDATESVEGLSGSYKSLAVQVDKLGDSYKDLPEEKDFLKRFTPPKPPAAIGKDEEGKEILGLPPTSQEYFDWLLDVESQLKVIEMQAEVIKNDTTLTGVEYAKQEKVLLNKRSILAYLVKGAADVTKQNLENLEIERKNTLAILQRKDLTDLERENANATLDTISKQIGGIKALTKEKEKGGRLDALLSKSIGRRLAVDLVVENLDLTIKRFQQLNDTIEEREAILKRQLELQDSIEKTENTTLTQEELSRNSVNREIEAKYKLLQDISQQERVLLDQAEERYQSELEALRGSSRLQTEAADNLIKQEKRVQDTKAEGAARDFAYIKERTEASADGAGNRTQAEETELQRRAQLVVQQEKQLAAKKQQILVSALALETRLYEQATAAAKRIRKSLLDFEQENGDKLLAYKRALQDKTIKMELDDLMRQVRIAEERVAYQKKFGTPEGVIDAQRELASKSGDVMVTLAGNITELRRSMSTQEADNFLASVYKLGVEGREISRDIRTSIDSRELENRMLGTSTDKAMEYARALVEVKTIQKDAAYVVVDTNTKRLTAEEEFAEKSKKNMAGLEAQIQELKTLSEDFVKVFQEADIKQVKFEIDLNFEGAETEWQKMLNTFAADGQKGIPLLIRPQMGPEFDAALEAMREAARRLEQLNQNRSANRLPGKAIGGGIPGYGGGDSVPVALEPGEWVIRKEAVRKYGASFLHMLNASLLPSGLSRIHSTPRVGMATGGAVGPMHHLAISVQNKTYNVQGDGFQIKGLMAALSRERLTTVGD